MQMLEDEEHEEPHEEVKKPVIDWDKSKLQGSMLHSRNLFKNVMDDEKLSSSHHELPQHFHGDLS